MPNLLKPGKYLPVTNRVLPVFPDRKETISGFPGLRCLLGRLDGSRGICMGRQLIAMGMGMGIMPG